MAMGGAFQELNVIQYAETPHARRGREGGLREEALNMHPIVMEKPRFT